VPVGAKSGIGQVCVGIAALIALVAPASASAVERHVTESWDPGSAPGMHDGTLRREASIAADGDVVIIDEGINPSLIGGEIEIDSSITLRGQGANATSITANELSRIFTITGPTTNVTVEDLTLEHGKVPDAAVADPGGNGGAINNIGGKLTLRRVIVRRSQGGKGGANNGGPGGNGGGGGGVFSSGDLDVIDSTFTDNSTGEGGESIIVDGLGGRGGGIEVGGSSNLNVSGSMISLNSTRAGERGGGIHSSGQTMELVNSTVLNNSGGEGAGVYEDSATNGRLTNVTLVGNFGFQPDTSGIAKSGGPAHIVIVENSLFALNGVDFGGGVGVTDNCGSVALLPIIGVGRNIAFPAETPGTTTPCPGSFQLLDPGIGFSPYSVVATANGGPTPTIALPSASPAIDLIPVAECATPVDQRGLPRPSGAGCDVGAFELQQPAAGAGSIPAGAIAAGSIPAGSAKKKCRKKKGRKTALASRKKCKKRKR
jgi:hypothetical protein